MLQDRKYEFTADGIVNRSSGEVIPHDEPVFIFRARDMFAAEMLSIYYDTVSNEEHARGVQKRHEDFMAFAREHPERMKSPDTDISGPEWE